jgi:hypothetical protein
MTDIHNITEKITETLSNVLKKTNVFDKIDKTNSILFTICLFCIFGNVYSFINSITIVDVYKQNRKILRNFNYNYHQIDNINKSILELKNIVNNTLEKENNNIKKTVYTSTSDFQLYMNKLKQYDYETEYECCDIISCKP